MLLERPFFGAPAGCLLVPYQPLRRERARNSMNSVQFLIWKRNYALLKFTKMVPKSFILLVITAFAMADCVRIYLHPSGTCTTLRFNN